jgi:transcriptional regulator with XRE-family HTH domain
MHIAERFEMLLAAHPRPDGRIWSGQEIDEATGGVVTRSYVTNLRKRRIENPGYEKLRAIAKAIGFSPELWFDEDLLSESGAYLEPDQERAAIAQKVSHLIEVLRNEATGESYTDAEVARLSFGDLSEEDVKAIRTGKLADPSVDQITALADVFGVHPSYFLNSAKRPPLLDQEAMEIFRDETVNAIAHKSLHLPGREKEMILGIIRQFEDSRDGANER